MRDAPVVAFSSISCTGIFLHATMKVFCLAVLTVVTLASAKEDATIMKRGVSDGSSIYGSSSPVYTKSAQSSPSQQEYLAQQYYQAQQAQAQQAPRVQAYSQPSVSKYSAVPTGQKYVYASQPQQQPQHIQYSSAADVSSFSYSSPVVEYNNLGLLHQLNGKPSSSSGSQQSYIASQSPKAQYTSSPRLQYVSSPKVQYSPAPKAHYSQSPRVQYTSDAGSSAGSPNYEDIYQQLIQRAEQSQHVAYQPAAQKVSYAQAPSAAAYQAKTAASQISYDSPSQQYYQQSQNAPNYEHQAQSSPQVYYSQSAAAQEPQYYSAPSQSKYGRAGITYV